MLELSAFFSFVFHSVLVIQTGVSSPSEQGSAARVGGGTDNGPTTGAPLTPPDQHRGQLICFFQLQRLSLALFRFDA